MWNVIYTIRYCVSCETNILKIFQFIRTQNFGSFYQTFFKRLGNILFFLQRLISTLRIIISNFPYKQTIFLLVDIIKTFNIVILAKADCWIPHEANSITICLVDRILKFPLLLWRTKLVFNFAILGFETNILIIALFDDFINNLLNHVTTTNCLIWKRWAMLMVPLLAFHKLSGQHLFYSVVWSKILNQTYKTFLRGSRICTCRSTEHKVSWFDYSSQNGGYSLTFITET
jgi:hypothetical protein